MESVTIGVSKRFFTLKEVVLRTKEGEELPCESISLALSMIQSVFNDKDFIYIVYGDQNITINKSYNIARWEYIKHEVLDLISYM